MITTDKCYDNKEWTWGYRENDSMGGYDPYSSSKGCAELVIQSYQNSFFKMNLYQQLAQLEQEMLLAGRSFRRSSNSRYS